MDTTSDLLKSFEKHWKKLDDKDKLIQLGKLKMLEDIKVMMDMYGESLARELKINNCESEEDCLNPKEIKVNKEYQDPELISVTSRPTTPEEPVVV
mgnify:CR=1 FL=1|tara:strand:+ start:282 stop:569 length:288 start_codon:yes stop_codon:yes gene_type:complete